MGVDKCTLAIQSFLEEKAQKAGGVLPPRLDDAELYRDFIENSNLHLGLKKTLSSRAFLSRVRIVCLKKHWCVERTGHFGRRAFSIMLCSDGSFKGSVTLEPKR